MKRTMFIFAVLLLAFSAMGAGFSSYSDAVQIETTAKTGTLALGITCLEVWQDGSQLFTQAGPSASTGYIGITDGAWRGTIGGASYYDSLTINASLCQGGFSPALQLEIANVGTLPARLSELSFDWGDLASIINWSLTSDGVQVASGTDISSLQSALQQVVIKPQASLDLDVQMQFAGDATTFTTGDYPVTMQFNRWNVSTS